MNYCENCERSKVEFMDLRDELATQEDEKLLLEEGYSKQLNKIQELILEIREDLFQFDKWLMLTDHQSHAWHYNRGKGYKNIVDKLLKVKEIIRLQGESG